MAGGWQPNKVASGGQCGRTDCIYVTNEPENARWYADQKENGVVLSIAVDVADLHVDPDDGIEDTVEEELARVVGNFVLRKDIPASAITLHAPEATAAMRL